MQNTLTQTVIDLWRQGRKTKSAPTGWISGNAVCCNDKRGRGGLRSDADGSWTWHCFNCQYKTGWRPGRFLTDKNKKFLRMLGANDDQIMQLSMAAMRLKEDIPILNAKSNIVTTFSPQELPKNSMPIVDALVQHPSNQNLLAVCDAILARKLDISRYYWSDEMPNRWIVPFTWHGVNVGWTARSIGNARPKYLSHTPNGYVYGLDHQKDDWQLLIACEGVLDADIIDGVAILGNNISNKQRESIERLNRQVIWVSDQDSTGLELTEQILEWGWAVSMPDWPGCKDINEAVIQYGRAATLLSIITSATRNRVAATLRLRQLRNRISDRHNIK